MIFDEGLEMLIKSSNLEKLVNGTRLKSVVRIEKQRSMTFRVWHVVTMEPKKEQFLVLDSSLVHAQHFTWYCDRVSRRGLKTQWNEVKPVFFHNTYVMISVILLNCIIPLSFISLKLYFSLTSYCYPFNRGDVFCRWGLLMLFDLNEDLLCPAFSTWRNSISALQPHFAEMFWTTYLCKT